MVGTAGSSLHFFYLSCLYEPCYEIFIDLILPYTICMLKLTHQCENIWKQAFQEGRELNEVKEEGLIWQEGKPGVSLCMKTGRRPCEDAALQEDVYEVLCSNSWAVWCEVCHSISTSQIWCPLLGCSVC